MRLRPRRPKRSLALRRAEYTEEQLLERIPVFNMAAFTTTLRHHKGEVAGDISDMLLTLMAFLAFKEMFPSRKGKTRTGPKQRLGRDFSVYVIFYASFPEQSMALGPTFTQQM